MKENRAFCHFFKEEAFSAQRGMVELVIRLNQVIRLQEAESIPIMEQKEQMKRDLIHRRLTALLIIMLNQWSRKLMS